jgi:hypothetical protein
MYMFHACYFQVVSYRWYGFDFAGCLSFSITTNLFCHSIDPAQKNSEINSEEKLWAFFLFLLPLNILSKLILCRNVLDVRIR